MPCGIQGTHNNLIRLWILWVHETERNQEMRNGSFTIKIEQRFFK